MKINKILSLLFLIIFISCNEETQKLQPEKYYQRDLQITYDNKTFNGTAVLPSKDKYSIKVKSVDKINLLTVTTCHREIAYYPDKVEFTFDYTPVKGIEDDGDCNLELFAANLEGKHAWGFIDLNAAKYALKATLRCNGENNKEYLGTSVCQSKVGLYQEIVFFYPVEISQINKCPIPESQDKKIWKLNLNLGECVYLFKETAFGTAKFHKLTTVGYEGILIRK